MAQFDSIAFGENKWNDKVNKNFGKAIQDSGLIPFDFVAPATGSLNYEVLNGILYFSGSFKVGATGTMTLGYLPTAFGAKSFTGKDMQTGDSLPLKIDNHGLLNITIDSETDYVSLDGVALYVGYVDLTNLGGGERTPLKPLIAIFKAILHTIGGGLNVIR